ncbi:MAG: glycoside hydrolase family 99-like domain-containing protein [Methylomicrobium sp.]
MTIPNKSNIAEGNRAFRVGELSEAIRHYVHAIVDTPELGKIVAGNLVLARQKYRASRQGLERRHVAVCGWELAHNAAQRVYGLAKLYKSFAEVEIIGSIFPQWGREIWEPIRNSNIAIHSFVVEDEGHFIEQAIKLVVKHPYDIIHLSSPRAPNIIFGMLYEVIWGAAILIDIDNEEPSLVGTEKATNVDEYLRLHGKFPALNELTSEDWTRIAKGLAREFLGITVSSSELQQQYGGEIVRYAPNQKPLNFSLNIDSLKKSIEKSGHSYSPLKHPQLKSLLPRSLFELDFIFNQMLEQTTKIEATRKIILSHDVIVCVHNAPEDVGLCLNSILKNDQDIRNIIVVDDFSNEETKRLLSDFNKLSNGKIRVISTDVQYGYTKAANIGLTASDADVKTLLNSDTIVTRLWATKILRKFLENPEIGVIGPLSNAASHQSVPSATGSKDQTAINQIPDGVSIEDIGSLCQSIGEKLSLPYVPLVHGFCMSISAKCLTKVGLFDEINFPRGYGEENDFCIRAQDAGFALGLALDTYIFHAKSKSYQSEERIALMNDGWQALVNKHGKRRLVQAIKVMELHPSLIKMRASIEEYFYSRIAAENPVLKESTTLGADISGLDNEVKAIAFYLPQFHPIPENDENWGEGFTEWTNVVKASPRFPGHYQPRLPGKLGFYDLRLSSVMTEQALLAKQYGIGGFCFYYYRFGSKRLLSLPIDNYLKNKEADLPFCYCWANEPWTRAWDGKTSDVLYDQIYDDFTFDGFSNDIAVATADNRYIRINGRPLVLIYQIAELPNPPDDIERMREKIRIKVGIDPLIGTVFSDRFKKHMLSFVDFVVQFPPHRIPRGGHRITMKRDQVKPYNPEQHDYYESYDEMVKSAISGASLMDKMFMGVCPDWDNSARRKTNATSLIGSTPDKFGKWVENVIGITKSNYINDKVIAPVFFINAWNEWAEGAVMEPSEKYKYEYLEAFNNAMKSSR